MGFYAGAIDCAERDSPGVMALKNNLYFTLTLRGWCAKLNVETSLSVWMILVFQRRKCYAFSARWL